MKLRQKLVKMNMWIAVAHDDFVIDSDDHSLIPIFSSQTIKAVMMTINACNDGVNDFSADSDKEDEEESDDRVYS